MEDYQRRVPLTCHEDYEPYVERLLAGERAQLTCAEPVYYAITSGSTGVPKYVPVTAEDMLVHYNGIYAGVFGMVREYYAQEPPEELFAKIFQVGEFARTRLPGGQMCGVRSASLYQWLDRDGGFDVRSSLASLEKFGALRRHVEKLLKELGQELNSGRVEADPFWKGQRETACDYCDFQLCCQFDPTNGCDKMRYLNRMDAGEFWERTGGEDRGGETD